MAIVSKIGSKSLKVRLLYFSIYAVLTAGAVTMVYPFMLMISGSMKSHVDIKYFDVIPKFLYNDTWLYRKFEESLFNEMVDEYNYSYSKSISSFETLPLPEKVNKKELAAMHSFLKTHPQPPYAYTAGMLDTRLSKTVPINLRKFKKYLADTYGKNIHEVNRELGTEYVSWNYVSIGVPRYLMRRDKPNASAFGKALDNFQKTIPPEERYFFSIIGFYRKEVLQNDYGRKIADYNKTHHTKYASYADVPLQRRYPANAAQITQTDWEHFVREIVGIQYVRADASALASFHSFLKAKYAGKVENLNSKYHTSYSSFEAIPLPTKPIFYGMSASDWNFFIVGWKDPLSGTLYQAPINSLYLTCIDFDYQDYLKSKYGNIKTCNAKLGTHYKTFSNIILPQENMHYAYFQTHKSPIKWEFVTRNYKTVANFILFHGRAVFNTVLYCLLAVASALIINPLAAYAMSRYKLPSTYKLLLFMLCTMAFPPMVTAIPNFLMLRKLGLLNTFAALILPAMANGYAIFLLKGFFDSQPQELYESAQLDGASEWVLFWHIAMSLSKPILAVIALQAFNLAYSNFMFAFVVCQDEKMWTLMVFLYQLQQRSGQAVIYASLIIAAIPTFMIFLFCQNIIMRGIVVPSEK